MLAVRLLRVRCVFAVCLLSADCALSLRLLRGRSVIPGFFREFARIYFAFFAHLLCICCEFTASSLRLRSALTASLHLVFCVFAARFLCVRSVKTKRKVCVFSVCTARSSRGDCEFSVRFLSVQYVFFVFTLC